MMDPIHSWVDPDEMRRVAEGLISRPRREKEPVRDDPGYGDDWVGFTAPAAETAGPASPPEAASPVPVGRAEDNARSSLESARRIAESGGLLTSAPQGVVGEDATPDPEPRAAQDPVCHPGSPFLERLRSYGQWLRQHVEARGFFVITREGEVLLDEIQSPKLLQVSRTLAHASRTANRQAGGLAVGSLHVKLGPGRILEVIPLGSLYGPLVLGVVVPCSLPLDHVGVVAGTLQRVVDETASAGKLGENREN
jgi:hypothetical protein